MNRDNVKYESLNEIINNSHKDPGYGNDTPNPSKIAPPSPRPKK